MKKHEKMLLGLTGLCLIVGLVGGKSKFSVYARSVFLLSSGSYLVLSVKPWQAKESERLYLQGLERDLVGLRSQLNVLHQGKHRTLRELRLARKLKVSSDRCKELRKSGAKLDEISDLEARIKLLSQQHNNYRKEIPELRKLSNQIALEAEQEAEIIASEIKLAAETEAEEIKRKTRESLQNTIVEPDKIAHRELLQQLESDRQSVIAEIERLQIISQQVEAEISEKIEKTEAVISEKKKLAAEQNNQIKKDIQQKAQEQFQAQMQKMQDVLEQLNNEIRSLESENQMLRAELQSLDLPRLPEGWSFQETYARALIEFYKCLGIKLDYESSFKEADKLRIRVVPREKKVGEQQLRGYSDRLQREMKLTELPDIATIDGTIQFLIKLVEIQQLKPAQLPTPKNQYPTPTAQLLIPEVVHPEISTEEAREFLQKREYQDFQPPQSRFNPKEPITQIERDWVTWLWNFCKIQDQNTIMRTVWKNSRGSGIKPGAGSIYRAARERLHEILDNAGIDRRENY